MLSFMLFCVAYYYCRFPFVLDYDAECCVPRMFIVRMCEQTGLLDFTSTCSCSLEH